MIIEASMVPPGSLESRETQQYTKWYFIQKKQADSVLKLVFHAL